MDRVVVAPPALDDDLSFTQRVEDFAVDLIAIRDTAIMFSP